MDGLDVDGMLRKLQGRIGAEIASARVQGLFDEFSALLQSTLGARLAATHTAIRSRRARGGGGRHFLHFRGI